MYHIGNCPQKKKFANFVNLEAFVNVFLHFFISAGIFIYEIGWITKVFSQTMVKMVIRKTFLPRMISDIQYIVLLQSKLIWQGIMQCFISLSFVKKLSVFWLSDYESMYVHVCMCNRVCMYIYVCCVVHTLLCILLCTIILSSFILGSLVKIRINVL